MAKSTENQKITKTTCDTVRTNGTRYAVWDADLKGFGVRVSASGVKTFVIRYRVGGGRTGVERMHTIGRYGPLTADKARGMAKLALAEVAAGGDPQGGRAASRAEMTVAELCGLYLSEGCATKKESTLATDRGRIERHIKPLLGRKRVSMVDRGDVERFLSDVAAGKTATTERTKARGKAVVTGGRGTATRTLGLLGSIMGFAVARKLRGDNPVRGVERFPDRTCDRFLSPAELGRLGAVLEAMEGEGVHPYAVASIRLLAFTGARRSEIAGLKWREVDFDRGILRLEDSKTGQKVLTLSPGAAAILAGVLPVAGSDFVFPAASGDGHYQGVAKVWAAARVRAGLPDVRLHDLRHTFASFGAGGGFGPPGHRRAIGTSQFGDHRAIRPPRRRSAPQGERLDRRTDRRGA